MLNGKTLTAVLVVTLLVRAAVAQSATSPQTTPATVPAAPSASLDTEVAALLTEMSDTDAAISDRATQKLLTMGLTALPSLGRAARVRDPQMRDHAITMLARIPWDAPGDSANVKSLIHFFGTRTPDQRRKVVQWLANMKGSDRQAAEHAMCRILMADPDYDVLWEVVTQIRLHPEENTPLAIGPIDIRRVSAPVKVVVARSREGREPAPSARLMIQALAEDAVANPRAQDRTEILRVVKDLIRLGRHSMNEAGAAKVIRNELPLTPPPQQPWLRRELYALHADVDLPEFQDDLKKIPPDMSDPTTLYAFSRMERRHGNLWSAELLGQIAFHAVAWKCQIKVENSHGGVPEARSQLGDDLVHEGWHDEASRELNEVLNSAPPEDMRDRVLACMALSSIDRETGDDRSVAEHLRIALETWDKYPDPEVRVRDQTLNLLPDDRLNLFAVMHWALLRQANKTHNLQECDHESLVLAALRPINDELLLDAYPHLVRNKRTAEAQALFDVNYRILKSAADVAADSPEAYARLAWTCAECDQHLDEALQAANKANKLEPNKVVFINTLAEVDFHRGQYDDAIKLEEQASRLAPKDRSLIANLARDRAAAATQPAAR